MKKSIVRFCRKDFREPTTENDLWADLLKNFNLPEDTEYVDFLPLREREREEITEQIIEQVKRCENG